VLYQDIAGDADAAVMCSPDPRLQDPSFNSLTGTTWATTTQCLDSTTETVVLVPVFNDGVRHSKRESLLSDIDCEVKMMLITAM
jgi:hypothetical protein